MEDKKREDEAEEIRQLNELLEDHGIVITEKVKWSPGDPVTNTGEAMLHADWEAHLQENHPDLYNIYIRDPKIFWEGYDAVLLEDHGLKRVKDGSGDIQFVEAEEEDNDEG